MDHESLRMFLHLSRTLHFGRTSRDCHISASALSRRVQRLEQAVGARLLERDNRRVVLTSAGRLLQRYAADTLGRWEEVQAGLRGRSDSLCGTISVFCTVTACQSFMPAVLSRFRQRFPDVTIQLETGYAVDALEMLQRDAVDISVAALPDLVPPDLVTRVVTYTPLLFVAPSAPCAVSSLVDEDPIDWTEVPMILPQTGLARQAVDAWFARQAITPHTYGEVTGNEAALSLISLGCGVGIVPRLVMEKSALSDSVRALSVMPRLPDFRVGVCVRRARLRSPLVAAFWDSLPDF